MAGLAKDSIAALNPDLALARIINDIRSDFIFAPHYAAVYSCAASELVEYVLRHLENGQFEPSLPITIEVPKRSRLSRPGSILSPVDRLAYQLVVDMLAPVAEAQLDRDRVLSYVLAPDDPRMFEEPRLSYAKLREQLTELASSGQWAMAIRTDVASFFERLYQHNLVNSLVSAGCDTSAVNCLEKLLAAWTERDSHGILQGLFPSDFLGNYYLCGLDAHLNLRGTPAIRYVDDLYIFTTSHTEALRILIDLAAYLRGEGLNLNEAKTQIAKAEHLIAEETELDRMFEAAGNEIRAHERIGVDWYSRQIVWDLFEEDTPVDEEEEPYDEPELDEDELHHLLATQSLYQKRTEATPTQIEKIDKFCLPVLSAFASPIAAEDAIAGILQRPHLSDVYASYIAKLIPHHPDLAAELASQAAISTLPYDWQVMWFIAALLSAKSIPGPLVDDSLRILRDGRRSTAVRAVCALLAGKFGSPAQRRIVRHQYSDEPSDYVRSAVLFAALYFPKNERETCIAAWGGHSFTNSLIAKSVKQLSRA